MQLHYNAYGSESSPALIILHGLFGLSDHWHSYGNIFGEKFRTYIPDARNHGRSPQSDVLNYQAMAEDMAEFMAQHRISSASFLGHSMGGKTAALTALLYPELVSKLIVVDIAPRSYPEHHDQVLEAMTSLDLNAFHYRKDIDEALAAKIPEASVRQFLLKNLQRDESGLFRWKLNLRAIEKNNAEIYKELPRDRRYDRPALFIRGEKSEYIQMDDLPLIGQLFPAAELITIKNAGHWVQVDAREEFTEVVLDFLSF